MSNNQELDLCPFCDQPAEISIASDFDGNDFYILMHHPEGCPVGIFKVSESKDALVTLWNTRATPPEAHTIEHRDAAETAADTMASLILGEPIGWTFHDAKWQEAIAELKNPGIEPEVQALVDVADEASMVMAYLTTHGIGGDVSRIDGRASVKSVSIDEAMNLIEQTGVKLREALAAFEQKGV